MSEESSIPVGGQGSRVDKQCVETLGSVFDLKRYALHDGPGIRTTVFFQGCPLRCRWCHNPESWLERHPGWERDEADSRKPSVNGDARRVSADQLVRELLRDEMFFDESGGGVTFGGGEPLAQPAFLRDMLKYCRKNGIHTAIDTTCHADWAILESLLEDTDIWLCDLKLMHPARHKEFTGMDNAKILANISRLGQMDAGSNSLRRPRIWIRMPIIPAVNDAPDDIDAAGTFLATLPNVEQVNLLPYHRLGTSKIDRMHLDIDSHHYESPTSDHIAALANRLSAFGLTVKVGG